MIKKQTLLLGLFLSCQAVAYNTSDTIQVQVTGQIITAVCDVAVDNTVDLGQILRTDLSTPGANSAPSVFTATLTHCSPELSKVTITFSGTPYTADPSYSQSIYANQLPDGAKDVGLQLLNFDANPFVNLANGVSYTMPLNPNANENRLHFIGRMYSPHGTPSAGEFKSAVTLNFTYE